MATGRRKRKPRIKIAKEIECCGEFCGQCGRLRLLENPPVIKCIEFDRELSPAFNDSVAERCSDCHMAERFACGDNINC